MIFYDKLCKEQNMLDSRNGNWDFKRFRNGNCRNFQKFILQKLEQKFELEKIRSYPELENNRKNIDCHALLTRRARTSSCRGSFAATVKKRSFPKSGSASTSSSAAEGAISGDRGKRSPPRGSGEYAGRASTCTGRAAVQRLRQNGYRII